MKDIEKAHKPVLVREVLDALKIKEFAHSKSQVKIIDATLGLGGHSIEIVKAGGKVLGIEADEESLKLARKRLKLACPPPFGSNERGSFTLVHGNFRDIKEIAEENSFEKVDGILFDLGISSFQLEKKRKGFSFQDLSAPLDLRLSEITQKITAKDLLKVLSYRQLREVFSFTMPFSLAVKLSKKIVRTRNVKEIRTVKDFIEITDTGVKSKPKLHPATLPFLALRIAVNSEIDNLKASLFQSFDLLQKSARLVVISFHSKEDVVVKSFFKGKEKEAVAKIINKKPIVPKRKEKEENPRSRSAKMRILEKI